jgi:hypothetical protein
MSNLLATVALGVVGPAALVALVAVHFVTRPGGSAPERTYKPTAPPLEPAPEPTTRVAPAAHIGAQDDAATTQWLGQMRDLEETTVALDRAQLAALFRRQDIEVGEAYVRDLETRLAAEQAASFGFVYLLEGASR